MTLALKQDTQYSYADYLTWPDTERWEIIDGIPVMMSPAPSRRHQEISLNIEHLITEYLSGKPCRLYHAPFDVRLSEAAAGDEHTMTVVQPDIVVVCDRGKLDDRGCKGTPDLIVEIVSPSTAGRDAGDKLDLYEKHGVREYWIVYPAEKMIMVFTPDTAGHYGKPRTCYGDNVLESTVLAGLMINLAEVFFNDDEPVLSDDAALGSKPT